MMINDRILKLMSLAVCCAYVNPLFWAQSQQREAKGHLIFKYLQLDLKGSLIPANSSMSTISAEKSSSPRPVAFIIP